jgi:NAD-dependent dihydropyrimidine dehydrogenase PreA subunit
VKHAVIDDIDTCTGCGKCKTICPFNAIRMHAGGVAQGRSDIALTTRILDA